MPLNMNSLQTLLRLKTPQQVQTGDPWMAQRQSEIASGMDEMLPDADSPDYKYDQIEQGRKYGVSLPRADARSSDMSRLRQMFGMKQQAHEQEMEQENLKGRYDVAGQVAGAQAAMDRLIASQAGQNYRAEGSQDTQREVAGIRADSADERGTQGATDRMALEKLRQTGRANEIENKRLDARGWFERLLNLNGRRTPVEASAAPIEDPGMGTGEPMWDPVTRRWVQ